MLIPLPDKLDYGGANALLKALPWESTEKVIFDFSPLRFSYPVAMLMLAGGVRVFAQKRGVLGRTTAIAGLNANNPAHSYLEHLGFFDFIRMPNRNKIGAASGGITYLPIRRICRAQFRASSNIDLHDELLEEADALGCVLAGATLEDHSIRKTLTYAIKEIVRNVFEHSGRLECFVAGQRWGDGRVEIVIMDEGCGITKSLSQSFNVQSDQEALEYAIRPGVSRLSAHPELLEASDNAGLGLFVLSEVAKSFGRFVLGSGSSALRLEAGGKPEVDSSNFPGTFVGLRLNLRPPNFQNLLDAILENAEAQTSGTDIKIRRSGSSRTA